MGTIIKRPASVKLITGIITASEEAFLQAEKALTRRFGRIDYKSQRIKFDFTDYYQQEMGKDLARYFISFSNLIDPKRLAQIKLVTNKIEKDIAQKLKAASRPVNIDPGYINDAKLVLASTKDFSHRIYLGKGIYAEITLYYKNNSFANLDWTYPDYRTDAYHGILTEIRKIFLSQKRELKNADKQG